MAPLDEQFYLSVRLSPLNNVLLPPLLQVLNNSKFIKPFVRQSPFFFVWEDATSAIQHFPSAKMAGCAEPGLKSIKPI